jgi:hypothetical protein
MKMKYMFMILTLIVVSLSAACSIGEVEDSAGMDNDAGTSSMKMDIPSDLDTSTSKMSNGELFEVTVSSNMEPLVLNEIHSWTVHIDDADGQAVEGAEIGVAGGMPQHNHGFPTEPRITEELGAGDYLLEGVKFSMAGWWEMKLDINSGSSSDTVVFNIIIE